MIWYLIYLAKISDYSINYGYEFKALLLSSIFSIFLIIIYFYNKKIYNNIIFIKIII